MVYADWRIKNRGFNQRELRRIHNGQYKVELRPEILNQGYTPEQLREANENYWRDNAKQIERRKLRSENLRLNNEKQKQKRNQSNEHE